MAKTCLIQPEEQPSISTRYEKNPPEFMETFKVNGVTIPVDVISSGSGPVDPIPPAGVHPVTAMQGQPISLHSPVEVAIGDEGALSSPWGIPYSVRVNSCVAQAGGFLIHGTIGGGAGSSID